MSAQAACIFCKIVEKTIPCNKIAETKNLLAFMDISPLSKGHVPDDDLSDLLPLAKKIAKAIGCSDYNILQNNGHIAQCLMNYGTHNIYSLDQAVDHVHFHIIPKPNSDTGLKMAWDPCENLDYDPAAYAQQISKNIA